MTTEVKNRTWVKDAAIIFLAVLLVLTFFSRTILNASLTEVATQQVHSGTITAKVRGTGKVVANGNNNVKAKGTVTIAKVMVRTGEEVKAGDVLFVLGAGDSDELEAAKNTLMELQMSYDTAVASMPLGGNFVREQNEVALLEKALNEAGEALEKAEKEMQQDSEGKQTKVTELLAEKTKTETALSDNTKSLDSKKLELETKKTALNEAKDNYQYLYNLYLQQKDIPYTSEEDEESIPSAVYRKVTEEEVEAAKNLANSLETEYIEFERDNAEQINDLQYIVNTLQYKLDAIDIELTNWTSDTDGTEKYKEKLAAYERAKADYTAAVADLNYSAASAGQSVNVAYINLQAIQNKIDRQKELIKELSGEGEENVIEATVSGTVTEVNCSSGDMVIKDDILAVIEVADMGYTVSFSVTNDQARRLKVGDEATISNFYWGNEIKATLKSIATDKENPQNKKVLTFDLEGNVTAGSELTVSVGQKSASYDLVVPNSAIRSDNNGQFVLAVSAKNSPLGNRYIAKRVKVDVLAEDDTNSAVTAELSSGDFVITTTSAPVSSGEQVRLADSAD